MAERRPNRVRGPEHDEFWSYCAGDELRLQRCQHCRHVQWPPVAQACELCAKTELAWETMSGQGKLVSWCTFYQPYYPETELPYDTIVVELDEGPLFISNPAGFTNDEAELDMAVSVAFIDCEDDAGPFRLPVFSRV